MVLALPAIRALKKAYPHARLTAIASPLGAEICECEPAIENVHVYDKKNGFSAFWEAVRFLKEESPDLSITLHASFRTALLPFLAGVPHRIVNNHSGRNFFSTIPVENSQVPKSAIARDFNALAPLGIRDKGEIPSLVLSESAASADFLRRHGLEGRPYVLIAPHAGRREKRWLLGGYRALARRIQGEMSLSVVFVASDSDDDFSEDHPAFRSDTVKDLGALILKSNLFIGNDAGPKHLACALGIPTLTLWAGEGIEEWHPYGTEGRHRIVTAPAGKFPAGIVPKDSAQQMKEISVEAVWETLLRMRSEKIF